MKHLYGRSLVVVVSIAVCMSHPATAQILLNPVGGTFSQPVYVTSAKDGRDRLFIVEQPGRIKVLQPGATTPCFSASAAPTRSATSW